MNYFLFIHIHSFLTFYKNYFFFYKMIILINFFIKMVNFKKIFTKINAFYKNKQIMNIEMVFSSIIFNFL